VHRATHERAYRATLRCPAGLPPYTPPLRAGQPQQIRRRRRRHRLHFVGAPQPNPTSTHGVRGQITALPPSVGAPLPVVSDSGPWVMFPHDTVPRRRVPVQQQTLPVTTGPTSTPPVCATRTLGGHQINLADEYASIADIKTALLPQPDSAVPMAVDEVADVRRSTSPSLTSPPPPSAPSSPITLIDQPSAALLRAARPLLVANTVFGTPAIRLAGTTAAPLTFAAVSVRPNRLQLVWQALERNVPRRSSPSTSSTAGASPALYSTFAGVTSTNTAVSLKTADVTPMPFGTTAGSTSPVPLIASVAPSQQPLGGHPSATRPPPRPFAVNPIVITESDDELLDADDVEP
jgi:hypothetical protein